MASKRSRTAKSAIADLSADSPSRPVTRSKRSRRSKRATKADDDDPPEAATDRQPHSAFAEASSVTPPPKTESVECPICLDSPPVHPIALACRHVYCYLCAKGLTESADGFDRGRCSLCRQPIEAGYLRQKDILERTRSDLASCTQGVDNWQWFYEGRDGWWKFEKRCNEELEECFQRKVKIMETVICGHMYIVDFGNLVQYRKDTLGRHRKIKRDVVFAKCKGVAGLVPKEDA